MAASAVIAGVVSNARKIDLHGWTADLTVDQVLAGKASLHDVIPIAWEELSARRPARFASGDRALVVLQPLPTQSLWRGRFPDPALQAKVLVVAAAGEAFLVTPDGPTLDALQHYLAMAPAARDGEPGRARLAELVANGQSGVADEALAMLEAVQGPIGDDAEASLLETARSPRRDDELRVRALRLAARRDTPPVRETAKALAAPGSPLRAQASLVLAGLPGGLSKEDVDALLGATEPELRVAGLHVLGTDDARQRLPKAAHDDKAGIVRAAAAKEMLTRFGVAAIPDTIGLLDDADAAVRTNTAVAIGTLGSASVEPLRNVADSGSERAALAACLGLTRTGKDGAAALLTISQKHPKEAVRNFAKLATGRGIGENHTPENPGD